MMWLRGFYRRVRSLLRAEAIHREIDEEVRFHIDMLTEENIRLRGMPPEEARRDAERRFGNLVRIKEQGYDVRGGRWLEALWQDVRYGARVLGKNPGFTLAAMLTLALGVGANTAIFSVFDAVLLRPLPFTEQGRLVVVWKRDRTADNPFVELSVPEFLNWQKQSRAFESLAAMPTTVYGYGYTVTGRGEPFQVESAKVSGNFFSTLGARAALGRTFTAEDDTPGAARVVVLSDTVWKNRFGADPGILGQEVALGGSNFTVIGVLPPEFTFPRGADVWTPILATMSQRTIEDRTAVFLQAVGRLKPGMTAEQGVAELNTIVGRLATQYPETHAEGHSAVITPLAELIFGKVRPALQLLFAATTLLLLIACANVANLLLARAAARRKEVSVRAALGASRGRLVRQFLTESLLLAVAGSFLGSVIANWLVPLLIVYAPDIPRIESARLNATVLGFTGFVTLLTALLFGLAPAVTASRAELSESLKEGGMKAPGGRSGGRLRSALVVAEVGVTLVLLVGAGLILQSFTRLRRVALGFDPRNVLTFQIRLQGTQYGQARERQDFFRQLIERLEAQPGVVAAGAVLIRPLEGAIGWDVPYMTEGQAADDARKNQVTNYEIVTPHYFRTMGIPVLAGRDFTERDMQETEQVVIVSKTMARRIFPPGVDPLGRRIKLDPEAPDSPWRTVVGVVGDARYRELENGRLDVYVPYRQESFPVRYVAVRTAGDPAMLAATARREVAALDRSQAVTGVTTMEQLVAKSLAQPRLNTLLLSSLALVAGLLASVGIYGVVSYAVSERTREIGIRMALGAQTSDVLKLIMRKGMTQVLIGVGIGLIASLALTRLMKSLLFGVSATDPLTFALIALLLTTIALLACYIPARRATKVDPMVALHNE